MVSLLLAASLLVLPLLPVLMLLLLIAAVSATITSYHTSRPMH
jgi:hypothetical protein